jgi:hypothetical protein
VLKKGKSKSGVDVVGLAVLIKSLSRSAYLGIAILAKHLVDKVWAYAGCSCNGAAAIIIVRRGVVAVVVVVGNWLLTTGLCSTEWKNGKQDYYTCNDGFTFE